MPEHNFEQQARDMVNGFEKEPAPEVWQNVRNTIQAPRRKRRFVLWWWLLPLALFSGSVVWYALTGHNKAAPSTTADAVKQKNNVPATTSNKPSITRQDDSKKEITRQESTVSNSSQKMDNVNTAPSSSANILSSRTGEKRTGNQVLKENWIRADTVNEPPTVAKEASKQSNNTLATLPPIAAEEKLANNSTSNTNSPQTSEVKDSISVVSLSKDSALTQPTAKSSTTHIVKPKKRTALQWGLIAEGGIAARKSSVFSLAGSEKSMDSRLPTQDFNAATSNVWGLTSNTNFSFSSTIKHGAAFSLGAALQKKINRSIAVFTDFTYDYQSYKITSTTYKDSLLLNYSLSTIIGSYQATQSFHFTSIFAGINWYFINTPKLQFGISAGADNMLLLAVNQKINSVSNSSFSVARMQGLSDSIFTKNNFYTYQPSLFAGVIVNITTGKRQWQFVPFARSSFRPFDKTTTSTNNHLFSAGLRAVYLLK